MKRQNRPLLVGTLAILTMCAAPLSAGIRGTRFTPIPEVGTVAASDGIAEIGRNDDWSPAAIGAAIHQGDELRTGTPGRVRVVFQDDSVLSVSEASHVVVNEQVFNASKGKTQSLMELLAGKVNAVVSEYYHSAGARYEIKTATAVAGVRGTEFSMEYDPREALTQVMGISGHVTVHSLVDPTGPGVIVTAYETTRITGGELPTAPQRLDDTIFRQRLQGIDFIGGGRSESLSSGHPVVAGASVPAPDCAGAVAPDANAPNTGQKKDASNLVGKSPVVVRGMTGSLGFVFGKH